MYLSVLHTERLDFQRGQCRWFGRYIYAYLLAEIEMFPDFWKKKKFLEAGRVLGHLLIAVITKTIIW